MKLQDTNAAFNLLSQYLMLEIKWQLTKKKLNMRPQLLLNKAPGSLSCRNKFKNMTKGHHKGSSNKRHRKNE